MSKQATEKSTLAGIIKVGRDAAKAGIQFKKFPNPQKLAMILSNERKMLRDYRLVFDDLGKRMDKLVVNASVDIEKAGREITKEILKEIQGEMVNGLKLVDKLGRQWDPAKYSKMVARTRTREFATAGLEAQMRNNDFDLYQVTDHGGEVDEDCNEIAGQVFRYSWSNNDKYPVAPFRCPVHPNCRHVETPYFEEVKSNG